MLKSTCWCKPCSQPSCAATRANSPKGNARVPQPATSAAGPSIPATRVAATSVHEAPTSRRQDGLDSRCNTTTNRSRPKRSATVPADTRDPMGARVMYSVTSPAWEEYRMCLKQLDTARTCDERQRALVTTRAPGATTSTNGPNGPDHVYSHVSSHRASTMPALCPSTRVCASWGEYEHVSKESRNGKAESEVVGCVQATKFRRCWMRM